MDDDDDEEEQQLDEKADPLVRLTPPPRKKSRRMTIELALKTAEPVQSVPWGTVVPIFIDSWMDGLLIGVVLLVSTHAAGIMALATTFEMGFLGISFGALLKPCGWKKWPVALLAPTMLVTGGIAGACFADMLNSNPAFFGGVVAFGSSAIFLVTKELLEQAYENIGHDRHLTVWVFVGFFFVIISERLFPEMRFI